MLSISFQYRPLFTLSLEHEYYVDNNPVDFQFIPSAASSAKAKKLGIIIKQTENKISVLFDGEKQELLTMLTPEELTFSFFVYTNNLYFNNFTQLPVETPANKILCFSNQSYQPKENNPCRIHSGENISDQDYKDLSFVTEHFPDEHPIKKPVAYIQITVPEIIKKQVEEGIPFNELTISNFYIRFSARKTFWKYAFVTRNRPLSNAASIETIDLPVTFSRQENEILLNKQEASVFLSSEPLLLKQLANYELKLIQKDEKQKVTEIIARLPLASIEMIKPESRAADTKIFSEIVVYI
jgi:hypothetical protein